MKKQVLALVSLLLLSFGAQAQAPAAAPAAPAMPPPAAGQGLVIDITDGTVSAQPIAIVPFQAPIAGLPTDVAQVISDDLYRSGLFKPLARDSMPQKPTDMANVNYSAWKGVNVDYVALGTLRPNERGQLVARFWLVDTANQKPLLGFDMPAADASQLRRVGHKIADLIYEKITGKPGFFSTSIAYVGATGYGYQRRYELVYADCDGQNPRTIATSREPLMSPAWSPNGKQLAYVGYERGRSAIYIQSVETGQVRKLLSEKGINGSPSWSPDGSKIALTLSYESNPDIYIVDSATGGNRRRLTDHYGIDTEASWAPDGQSLVFTSDRGGSPQIYKISVNGGEPERLTFEGRQNLKASYSPDGRQLVMVNANGGAYRVALYDVATKQLTALTQGNLDESPQFAPNGTVVIYATQTGSGAELATVALDGNTRVRLRKAGDVREPAWGPITK